MKINCDKITLWIVLAILIVALIFLCYIWIDCIIQYNQYSIMEYDDLKCEELTFEKYVKINGVKRNITYELHFQEYEKAFEIWTIPQKGLDKNLLAAVNRKEELLVYYRQASSNKYDYEICELRHGNKTLLSFDDFKKLNQNNQLIGIVACPIFIIGLIYCACTFPGSILNQTNVKKRKKKKRRRNRH